MSQSVPKPTTNSNDVSSWFIPPYIIPAFIGAAVIVRWAYLLFF